MLGADSIHATLKKEWGFVVWAAGSVLAYLGLLWVDAVHGTLRNQFVTQTIGYYLLAFLFFVGLLVWSEKRPLSMKWVWGAAIFFRILFLFTTPTLSDDVYRYMWDGYVANNGISPYAFAIDSPDLDYLDIPQRALANNSWMASPYMPVAQWVFWGLAFLFPLQPFFFQLLMIIFDLLSGVLIAKLLALGQFPRHHLILYLLNPFVIVEVAHSAHIDAWMIFLLLTAVWLTVKDLTGLQTPFLNRQLAPSTKSHQEGGRKPVRSNFAAPLLLALSTMTKIIPILTFPILFWRWSWWQRIFYGSVTFALLIPAGLRAGWGLTGDLNGTGLFGALRIYAEFWSFNSALFKWILAIYEQNGAEDPLALAKRTALIMILFLLIWVWLAARKVDSVAGMMRLTAVPFIGYILLAPTVHPWYTLTVVAMLPFFPPTKNESSKRGWVLVGAWLYLNATLIFSYLTYRDPLDYGELAWVGQLEWIPTLLLIAIYLALKLIGGINKSS